MFDCLPVVRHPRGGHFDNGDVQKALQMAVEASRLQQAMDDHATKACRATKDVYAIMALQIRMMLSHVRQKQVLSPETISKRKKRVHPFPAFRDEGTGDEQDSGDEGMQQVIATSFDGKMARQLLADSSSRLANFRTLSGWPNIENNAVICFNENTI